MNLVFWALSLFIGINAKGLFKDLPSDTVVHKTIIATEVGIAKDFNYFGGMGKLGPLVTELMGEIPYTAIGFTFMNEGYLISAKRKCVDFVKNQVSIEDSIAIDISIYPIYEKDGDDPLSIITDVRKLSNDTIPQ